MRCPTRVAQLIFFVPVRTVGSISAKIWTNRKSRLFCVYCIISTKHAAKDLFKPEEMALRSKYPPIFWSRLCESCKIAYFRQFPWVSIKKSSCFLIENAVACCSVAYSSEKQSRIKSWLPCPQGNRVNYQTTFPLIPCCGFRRWQFPRTNGTDRQLFSQNIACRSWISCIWHLKRHHQADFWTKQRLSVQRLILPTDFFHRSRKIYPAFRGRQGMTLT